MRLKLIVAIVVSLLLCTLATLELPELINLTDDTSNDFSLVVFVENTAVAVKDQMVHLERHPVLAGIQCRRPAPGFRSHSLVRSSDNMLHSLCIQRT
jgi:hypothetical protein